jgi:hypothetical protein
MILIVCCLAVRFLTGKSKCSPPKTPSVSCVREKESRSDWRRSLPSQCKMTTRWSSMWMADCVSITPSFKLCWGKGISERSEETGDEVSHLLSKKE